MNVHVLGGLQVAALLVSASYGIGFLFGSGEMALSHGMAGGLYGIATALGMFVLAAFARRLWSAGLPIWDLFGRVHGEQMRRAVAVLSLVWMGGVLAAQIQGGLAIASLSGLSGWARHAVVLTLMLVASRLELRFASRVFGLCLLASAAVLLYALVDAGGVATYFAAAPVFLQDLGTFSPLRVLAIVIAVTMLVCTGADYHQFVLAARRPMAALVGCGLAGVALAAIAFLPPAVVLAFGNAGRLDGISDPRQVVPFALAKAATGLWPGADWMLLIALSAAALGSGAAIVRAMASALASAVAPVKAGEAVPAIYACATLALGAVIGARGQGIVDTMVSVNGVYIASIGWVFVMLLRGTTMPARQAGAIMAAGFTASVVVYAAGWGGWLGSEADIVSLAGGLLASAIVAFACRAKNALGSGSTFGSWRGGTLGDR